MNVSIIGSCLSRDMFNSNFVPNYKEYFNVYSYFPKTTMLSIMSGPVTYRHVRLMNSDAKKTAKMHWFQECEKTTLKCLESNRPDILLMDFYGDVRHGVVSYKGEYILKDLKGLKKRGIINPAGLGIVYHYKKNTEDYITMWKNSFDRFMDWMQKNLPETQIVINTAKGSIIATDEAGNSYVSKKAKKIDIERMNALWRIFDEYAIEKYHLRAITYEKDYTLDPNYIYGGLGSEICHFHMDYYQDCFQKFLEVTKDCHEITQKESHTNLVTDSAFELDLRHWTHLTGEYEFIEYPGYRAIRPVDCRETLGEYRPQVWSKPIEVIDDGETEYTLSFYIKISDMSKCDKDTVLFAVRSFKYLHQAKFTKAIDAYKCKIKRREIPENEEYFYTFTFKPTGKYVRVAPFLNEFMPGVEYSRIKFERAHGASEYTK